MKNDRLIEGIFIGIFIGAILILIVFAMDPR